MEYVKCNYKDGKASHILKGKVEDMRVVHYEKGMSTYSIPQENFINATFFSWQKDGKYFSVSPFVENSNKHRWASHDQKSAQSCFIFYKDGTVDMKRIKNISELDMNNILHVVGGVGLVNLKDSAFKYDPKGEGFGNDILRNCEKSVLGYRDGEIFLVATSMYHSSSTQYDLLDLCREHGFVYAISLDGGGSTVLKYGTEYKMRGDGRKIANGLYFVKGVDETKPQSPSQMKQKLVILSDGHGENTAGKRSHKFDDGYVLKENYFNEPVVDYIKTSLSKYKCEICHVSDGKEDTSLKARTDKANKTYKDMCERYGKKNVDCVYVSVHANHDGGTSWSQANGIDTFAYPKSDKALHTLLLNKLIAATGLRCRGVKEENFHELRETSMTACLCECGFMSNLNEATLLRSDVYRRKCADAITDGIVEYMNLVKIVEDKPTEKPVEPPVESNKFYRVCVGSYGDKANADKMVRELEGKGYKPFIAVYEK